MHTLFYTKPAAQWNEALPLGNGRLGAMVFGDMKHSRLALNEDSMWYGGPADRNNPDARANLEKVRALILAGRIPEAERLLPYAFSGTPDRMRAYQPLGDLHLTFFYGDDSLPRNTGSSHHDDTAYADYRRSLHLETAVHRVSYQANGVRYTRDTFISAPGDGLFVRIEADRPGAVCLDALLSRPVFWRRSWAVSGDTIALSGDLGAGGSTFCTMLRAQAVGGTVETIGNRIVVTGADSVMLVLSAATTFRHKDPEAECLRALDCAMAVLYEQALAKHIEDHRSLFGRMSLQLAGDASLDALPTDERLQRVRDGGTDAGLEALYFAFGRYLLIASSRQGTLAANLQGIWNQEFQPPWGSGYTININTQMNYWPAEPANLSECHEPLFDLIRSMVENGRHTARAMYGCRGFAAHHNTDIWGDTAVQGFWIPGSFWALGAAWLCTHLWTRYQYSLDIDFLREAYPLMAEAALFVSDFLIEVDGQLVTCPTASPENTYTLPSGVIGSICAGTTMDASIICDLFGACIDAADLLGTDRDFARTLVAQREKLPPLSIGKHGQIIEWMQDYDEKEPGHRHISQLYALYPSSQITLGDTPELAEAARTTLARRLSHGGGHTGWSRAWILCMYARLGDGDEAGEHLRQLLAYSTLTNLLDNHPPFQIDGNFGAVAGICEMLAQGSGERIQLLPALPSRWEAGEVNGLRLRGGITLGLSWTDGRPRSATLEASAGDCTVQLQFGKESRTVQLVQGEPIAIAW